MSGKMGSRATGRKPETVRRQNAKTTGAFGKETDEQVVSGETNQNMDKAVHSKATRQTRRGT